MKSVLVVLSIIAAAGLIGAACGDDEGDASDDPAQGRKFESAPIDDLEIIVRETAPPQYALRIVSGLPNGCAEFAEARLALQVDFQLAVRVINSVPSDPEAVCTQEYRTHESTLELGSEFVPGGEYVVKVNDKEVKFTAQ